MFKLGQFTPQLKLLFHTERINNWLCGKNIYPVLIEFDLSNACNHKCNFCTFDYLYDKSILDVDVAIKTVEEFRKLGIRAINWTGGGEPLVNKGFVDIASKAYVSGIEQGIFTNGALLNKDNINTIVDTHTWVRVSIDSGTRETFKNIRGKDDFDLVKENIRELVRAKEKRKSNISIGIGFVITPDNYQDIEYFSDLINELGVDYGQYKPCINNMFHSSQIDKAWWDSVVKPRLEGVFNSNEKAVINYYKFNDLTGSNLDRPYDKCYGHVFCPCIGADGNVWLCTHLRGVKGYSFGNIYNQSFKDIWEGEERNKAISKLDIKDCQFCCKNNEINKVLYHIKHPQRDFHVNFL